MAPATDEWVTVEVRLRRPVVDVVDQLARVSGHSRSAYIRWMVEMLLHHRTYLALFGAITRKPEEGSADER